MTEIIYIQACTEPHKILLFWAKYKCKWNYSPIFSVKYEAANILSIKMHYYELLLNSSFSVSSFHCICRAHQWLCILSCIVLSKRWNGIYHYVIFICLFPLSLSALHKPIRNTIRVGSLRLIWLLPEVSLYNPQTIPGFELKAPCPCLWFEVDAKDLLCLTLMSHNVPSTGGTEG